MAPEDGLDVFIWAGFASKKGPVTITQAFVLTGMYVCTYVCMYVCMYVVMYVCFYVTYVCMYVCMFLCYVSMYVAHCSHLIPLSMDVSILLVHTGEKGERKEASVKGAVPPKAAVIGGEAAAAPAAAAGGGNDDGKQQQQLRGNNGAVRV